MKKSAIILDILLLSTLILSSDIQGRTRNKYVNIFGKNNAYQKVKLLKSKTKYWITTSTKLNQNTTDIVLHQPMENNLSVYNSFEKNLPENSAAEFLMNNATYKSISKELDINRSKRNDHYHNFENSTDQYNKTFSEKNRLDAIRNFIFPKTWTWVLIAFHSAIFIIGIVGNTLVCIAVYKNQMMRTVTNYFIVNLAAADFLVILFCLPPSLVWDVTMTWFFGNATCKLVLYLQNVSVTVSVLTLAFISIDRWYAICLPLKFNSTAVRAQTAIGIIWFISLLFGIPEMVYSTTISPKLGVQTIYFTQCVPVWSNETDISRKADTIFTILKIIFSYFLPLLFMSIAYTQIIRVLWKSGNVAHQIMGRTGIQTNNFTMSSNTSTESQLQSRRKVAKMLVAVVAMFAICYFPVHLYSLLRFTVGLKNSDKNRVFALISHWLCYANSAVNPIIYNFMSGKFRKEFYSTFAKCSKRDRSEASTYIYDRCATNQRNSRSRTETIPLNNLDHSFNETT